MLFYKAKKMQICIDGRHIKCYKDFITEMEQKLLFPRECNGSIDRYLDWIRDLSWLHQDCIIIHVINSEILKENCPEAQDIISDIQNIIIPFWKHEYKKCIVGGVQKQIVLNLL